MAADLPDPRPRATLKPYVPFRWPGGAPVPLAPAPSELNINVSQVFLQRQSRREFAALPLEKLGHLLSFCCRANSRTSSALGFEQQYRGVPSAGAVHPIHVLVQRERSGVWEHYDEVNHALVRIDSSENLAGSARAQADGIVPSGDATLFAFAAEPGKTDAKYEDPASLIWRDAGVVVGAVAWAAEALGLNCCPLGATGTKHVSPLGPAGTFFGTGMLLVGGRPSVG